MEKKNNEYELSYFAPDTVLEGTIRSAGDVEVAGEFKGEIEAQGKVVLRSKIQGNVTSDSLKLQGCDLEGDVKVKGAVSISEDSVVHGNVSADELQCGGSVTGDLLIGDDTVLEETAKVTGNIKTGTVAVMRGAKIQGGLETE
ncbi:MAG: polymer-forming cytoskeletal protein [Firmicutes bacterium]|nr:polymer-forming cytoskeletal protein [Bacillota bacterium]